MAAAEKLGAAVRTGRVIIEAVRPEIDSGRFPIKRVQGDVVAVEADVFVEGHESLSCALLYRRKGASRWTELPMTPLDNDRWSASFEVAELGRYQYTVLAWHDPFKTWRRDLEKRIAADQDIRIDLEIGANIVASTAEISPAKDATRLRRYAELMRGTDDVLARTTALDAQLAALMALRTNREPATRHDRELEVIVDPPRAGFSAWYELFPRSTSGAAAKHGSFKDVEKWLPRIAGLGFDVLYFPPIHPIGTTFRKGRNNTLSALESDVGSPWAIGGTEGGHKSIHPQLGTLAEFKHLVKKARDFNIEIALDIAFQASPDHPYVKEHPEWFRHRPDGSIQYAENPPKKYQDIYPFDFESADAGGLWKELRNIFEYWADQGVRVFRVDNPHTKPFPFWEWAISTLKQKHPDLIFLSEAFTRPKVMYRLAKLGFTQSYTYFAWRHTKHDLVEYMTELTQTEVSEFFRPNFWPNTPDILTEPFVQHGRPVFMSRLVLAATLSSNYGIYGPAYETLENVPREATSEEYLNSEKYEIRAWDIENRPNISALIAKVNHARKQNLALHTNRNLLFHRIDNDNLIVYSKHTDDRSNVIITAVNLDPKSTHSGWVELPLEQLRLPSDGTFRVRDLLTDAVYEWRGAWNYVELNPNHLPAHILRVERD